LKLDVLPLLGKRITLRWGQSHVLVLLISVLARYRGWRWYGNIGIRILMILLLLVLLREVRSSARSSL
jgi:hypothetical protein